jgi:Fe2+ transport system protein B
MPYPLKLNPTGPYRYFIPREEWRITDILMSPMVLMMVLPLVLILILPKMMSDPETRKEMEQMQMPKYEMPEMSEMLTSFFGGGSEDKKGGQKAIKSKKNN